MEADLLDGEHPEPVPLLLGAAGSVEITEIAGPTSNGIEKIHNWLSGGHQVELEQYRVNLAQIVQRLRRTGARLIWASTTPAPQGKLSPPRKPGDEIPFNEVALAIMQRHGVAVNELHTFAAKRLAEIQLPANVHCSEERIPATCRTSRGTPLAAATRGHAVILAGHLTVVD
jgi:acyl-CoA thioesterase-1